MKRLALAALTAAACGYAGEYSAGPVPGPAGAGGYSADPGGYGATVGGAKDIGYARDVIRQGGVPDPTTISVEGLLSEHDLPISGPACTELFCVRPVLGWADALDTGQRHVWVQLGMTSGLPAGWQRPPLDVVVVIDKSASMGVDMDQTTTAVARLVDRLRADDRVAILAFDDATRVVHDLGAPADKEAVKRSVKALAASGGFAIDAAVARAYDTLRARRDANGRLARVMVFSCGFPTDMASFESHVKSGAEAGIGTTFFGVLLGYSVPVSDLLAKTPGGASYYLEGLEKVEQVFDHDFDVMVTPLAYDLHLALEIPAPLALDRLFGVPPARTIEVSTVFLSHRRGALVARLTGDLPPTAVATLRLTYRAEPALGLTATDQAESVDVPMEARSSPTPFFAGPGVRKAVALVNQAEQMKAAASKWAQGDKPKAAELLTALATYLRAEQQALADPALLPEIALVEQLKQNVER